MPTAQEITRLDATCEKAMVNEVKFFIHSYEDFMTSENEKLQLHALNAANVDRYNKVRIQYPGFIWDPPIIDINKLVIVVQSIYPAQVVEYSLGHGKKSDSDMEGNDKHKVEETAGLLPPSKPKGDNNNYDESFREFNEEQSKSMMVIEVHISHRIGTVITTGPGQGHLKTAHTRKHIDMRFQIEGIA